jgi:hypothetical protein
MKKKIPAMLAAAAAEFWKWEKNSIQAYWRGYM